MSGATLWLLATGGCALAVAWPFPAIAQPSGAWPGRFEATASGTWSGGYPVGSARATLTENRVPTGGRVTLFESTTELQSTAAFEARVGFHLTRAVGMEGVFSYARPPVRVSVSGDIENLPPATFVAERLSQYVVEASGVVHLTRWAFRQGRAVPFVMAGGGYLRQLHDGGGLVESGQVYHVGGGLKYVFMSRRGRFFKGLGARGDARLFVKSGAFDLEDKRRVGGTGGAGLLVMF